MGIHWHPYDPITRFWLRILGGQTFDVGKYTVFEIYGY